jgi:hypothetical protein
MRFMSGFLGFALLSIVLGALVLLIAEIASQGNTLAVGFFVILGWPVAILLGLVIGIPLGLRICTHVQMLEAADSEDLSKPLPRPSQRVRWTGGAIVGSGLLTVIFLSLMFWWSEPPSDQSLIANFQSNRVSFNNLATMIEQDKKNSKMQEKISPINLNDIGIMQERQVEYEKLIRQTNIKSFGITNMPSSVDFTYWVHGSAISSTSIKGYALIKCPEDQSLSKFQKFLKTQNYRWIEGNWYIYSHYYQG